MEAAHLGVEPLLGLPLEPLALLHELGLGSLDARSGVLDLGRDLVHPVLGVFGRLRGGLDLLRRPGIGVGADRLDPSGELALELLPDASFELGTAPLEKLLLPLRASRFLADALLPAGLAGHAGCLRLDLLEAPLHGIESAGGPLSFPLEVLLQGHDLVGRALIGRRRCLHLPLEALPALTLTHRRRLYSLPGPPFATAKCCPMPPPPPASDETSRGGFALTELVARLMLAAHVA